MKLGYARVSTKEQDTALQISALKSAGVSVFWEDQRSGVKHRPALEELLGLLQAGDELLVYKVDRLARSLLDLMRIAARVEACGATLRSLTEPIETSTPIGRMIFQLLGAFAEFERNVIKERCDAGRVTALSKGIRFGRPRTFDYEMAFRMRKNGATINQIVKELGVSRAAANRACFALGRDSMPGKDVRSA